MTRLVSLFSCVFAVVLSVCDCRAAAALASAADSDAVEAYVLMAEPGGELYSCAGHIAIRLRSEAHKLDFCYSYESEPVSERVLTFLAGKLKMGMFAVPTETFLGFYRKNNRAVRQYRLNLPPEVKVRLCKVMDQRVAEGINLPYDFTERGCAQTALRDLISALQPLTLDFGHCLDKLAKKTRREIFYDSLPDFPWNRFMVMTLVGIDGDACVPTSQRVVIPADLLCLLKEAKVLGRYVVEGEGEQVVTGRQVQSSHWFSPPLAGLLLIMMALAGAWMKEGSQNRLVRIGGRVCRGALLVLYVILCVFFTYLVFLSGLPATACQWLVMPFNVLPLLFWKWRTKWRWYYVAGMVVWMIGMAVYPHRLTDPAYYLVTGAYVAFFAGCLNGGKKARCNRGG